MFFQKQLLPVSMILIILFSNGLFAEEVEDIVDDVIKDVEVIKPDKKKVDEKKLEQEETAGPDYFTPIQFSFFSPLQAFPAYFRVNGLRLNIPYGNNKTVSGIDLGIANKSENLYGLGCAAFISHRTNEMYGVNISGIFNLSQGTDNGFSFAGFYNEVETVNGVQVTALATRAKKVNGVQIGLLNTAHKMNGVQIGILNYCKDQPFRYTLFFNFWDSANDEEK